MTDFRELTNRILIPLEKFYRGLKYFRAGEITNSGSSFVMFVVKSLSVTNTSKESPTQTVSNLETPSWSFQHQSQHRYGHKIRMVMRHKILFLR